MSSNKKEMRVMNLLAKRQSTYRKRKKIRRPQVCMLCSFFGLLLFGERVNAEMYSITYTEDGKDMVREFPFNPNPADPSTFNRFINSARWRSGTKREFFNLRYCGIGSGLYSETEQIIILSPHSEPRLQKAFSCGSDFKEYNALGQRTCIDSRVMVSVRPREITEVRSDNVKIYYSKPSECGPYMQVATPQSTSPSIKSSPDRTSPKMQASTIGKISHNENQKLLSI